MVSVVLVWVRLLNGMHHKSLRENIRHIVACSLVNVSHLPANEFGSAAVSVRTVRWNFNKSVVCRQTPQRSSVALASFIILAESKTMRPSRAEFVVMPSSHSDGRWWRPSHVFVSEIFRCVNWKVYNANVCNDDGVVEVSLSLSAARFA